MPFDAAALNLAMNEIVSSTIQLRLHTGDPGAGANGNANEVQTSGGYARQTVTSTGWPSAANGDVDNDDDIAFGTATADWGTVVWLSGWNSAGSTRYFRQQLDASATVNSGDSYSIPAGDLDLTSSSS